MCVCGGELEAKPRVKGCKTPSSKLNTTTAVLKSQLEPSSQAPHKTGLSTTEGREAHRTLLLTVNTDTLGKEEPLSAVCPLLSLPGSTQNEEIECENKIQREKSGVDKVVGSEEEQSECIMYTCETVKEQISLIQK